MSKKQPVTWLTIIALAVIVTLTAFVRSPGARAEDNQEKHKQDRNEERDSRIARGLQIAPVPLNLEGKNRALVGLGSYLVNAVASCNDCHSAGPQTQFAAGGNPYFGQPTKENAATYLGGGRNFGPLVPGSPDIVSRNLTPDKTGLPAGGQSFSEFRQVLKTGVDFDHLHPPCAPGQTTDCLPPPFDGNLLQIMPWPIYQNLGEHDIRAIYEYLSAIPCIEGPPPPSVLHNDCQ
jgi:cytochrome c553